MPAPARFVQKINSMFVQFISRQLLLYMVLYRCSKGNTLEIPNRTVTATSRNFKRNFKKGVDKPNRVWYNKDVPKGTKKS
nr:MAG TPA: hypothetical protein [Caudoviricetes sp.]